MPKPSREPIGPIVVKTLKLLGLVAICLGLASFVFAHVFLVPKLDALWTAGDYRPPLLGRLVISLSQRARDYFLGIVLGGFALLFAWTRTKPTRPVDRRPD